MKHTKTHSLSQSFLALILTLGVSLSTGYQAGTAYVAASNHSFTALLTAPVVRSSSSSVPKKRKTIQKTVNRALIKKPRTRTSTGTLYVAPSSKAPAVPIKAGCGDALLIKVLGEECDDANALSGDGCSATCKLEPGFTCGGTPTECFTICGDGILTAVDKCDDGNEVGGDGCSGVCKVEFGYTCKNSPSFCEITPYCGDGIVASTEACDDGNSASGDGCYKCNAE